MADKNSKINVLRNKQINNKISSKIIKKRGPYVLKDIFNNIEEINNITKRKGKVQNNATIKKTLQIFNKNYFEPQPLKLSEDNNTKKTNDTTPKNEDSKFVVNKENRSSSCKENIMSQEFINLATDILETTSEINKLNINVCESASQQEPSNTNESYETQNKIKNNEPNNTSTKIEKVLTDDFDKYTYLINYLDHNYNPNCNLEQDSFLQNKLIIKNKTSIENLTITDEIDRNIKMQTNSREEKYEHFTKLEKRVVFGEDVVCMSPDVSRNVIKRKRPSPKHDEIRRTNFKLTSGTNDTSRTNKKRKRKENKSKKEIINSLREQLKMQITFEPQSMFEALKLLAQSSVIK